MAGLVGGRVRSEAYGPASAGRGLPFGQTPPRSNEVPKLPPAHRPLSSNVSDLPHVRRVTTTAGDVEFLDISRGLPILYFHGTGAGADSMPPLERPLLEDGCRLIIPNRPGYFGTPLDDRRSAADCADLMAALLDQLALQRVVLIGTSGGGPPAAVFAARHPTRTAGLVMQCAQSHAWDGPRWLPERQRWLYPLLRYRRLRPGLNVAHRLAGRLTPASVGPVLRFFSGPRFDDVRDDEAAERLMDQLITSSARCAQQPAGIDNDLEILFDPATTVPPNAIACPTLIIHDRADPVVPFCHAEWLRQAVPHARWTDHTLGGHLIWFGRDVQQMHAERMRFVRDVFNQ
jgi:pimeloyl-ACP methyl ester carboxylesterase